MILVKDNRDSKEVITAINGYLRSFGLTDIIKKNFAPYTFSYTGDKMDVVTFHYNDTQTNLRRSYTREWIEWMLDTHGSIFFVASVDNTATQYDVLDEMECVWKENGILMTLNGPIEMCDKLIVIASARKLCHDIYGIELDHQLVQNISTDDDHVRSFHGHWKDAIFECDIDAEIIGEYWIFASDKFTIKVFRDYLDVFDILSVKSNLPFEIDRVNGTIEVMPSKKGFLHLEIPSETESLKMSYMVHKV